METEKRLAELQKILAELPKGNITRKVIRGRQRMYLQWREAGRNMSRYVKAADEPAVAALVEKRKQLEQEYNQLLSMSERPVTKKAYTYFTNVTTGAKLLTACKKVAVYKERYCMDILKRYLSTDSLGRVCLVFGLRRTGKTTMLFQAMRKLPLAETAYIKIMPSDTMEALNKDLQALSEAGYKYVFIDEITLMQDFIESASLLSDVYAMFGMKLVLSGTDSLGFAIAAEEELYNRSITIHTTFIPFKEYSALLGINDIDEYIRYGGTLRAGETEFEDSELLDDGISFRDDESTRRYIDTAIARNIQHSLACYQNGGHFRHLVELYENNELTNVINRIIEDMNHRFLLSVLNSDFRAHDLGSAAQLERKQAATEHADSILDKIDKKMVTGRLMKILDIFNKNQLTVELTTDHIKEVKEYLKRLDLIIDCPVETLGNIKPSNNVLFTQPGMRYCQAQALTFALMQDKAFKKYPASQRKEICDRILEEVRGRMLEEIVILETLKTLPKSQRCFKLYFDIGEFDMVVADTETVTCRIYEVKHSEAVEERQYRYLVDKEKCCLTEFEYGKITQKSVLYRGETKIVDGIHYQNVVEYLETIGSIAAGASADSIH